MAEKGGGVTAWLRLLLDKRAADKLRQETQQALDKGTDPKKAKKNTQEVKGALSGLIGVAKKVAAALASIWVVKQVAAYGKAVFDLGARVNAVRSQFRTVFGTISKGLEDTLAGWQKMAGVTRTEMREILAALGSMSQGLGMSVERSAEFSAQVIRLAGDLASFSGGAFTTASAANLLQSALIGNTEAARSLMVNFTAADVQQRAMEQTSKKTAAALTQEEKAIAALSVITERAGPQIGDLARTQHEADNRAKQLSATWREMKETISASLLPVFDALFTKLDEVDALEKLDAAAKAVAANMGEIVATVVALTKALVIAGGIAAIVRLTTAVRAARAATDAWKASMAGAQVMMGPKGWFVLGIAALTELFRRQGKAARDAAADNHTWRDSLDGMSIEELEAELQAISESRKTVQGQLDYFTANGDEIMARDAQRRLDKIKQMGLEVVGQLHRAQAAAAGSPLDGGGGSGTVDTDPNKTRRTAIDLLTKALELRQANFADVTRLRALEGELNSALKAGNLQLEDRIAAAEDLLKIRTALNASVIGALGSTEADTSGAARRIRGRADSNIQDINRIPFMLAGAGGPDSADIERQQELISRLESAAVSAASVVTSAWEDAFTLMRDGFDGLGGLAEAAGRGIAGAMLGGIRDFASGKVKENIAAAIEAAAYALGFISHGNFVSSSAAWASAAEHTAAASAWGALGGAGGAGASAAMGRGRGSGAALPTGAQDPGTWQAEESRGLRGDTRPLIDVSKLPPAMTPLQVARDRQWLEIAYRTDQVRGVGR